MLLPNTTKEHKRENIQENSCWQCCLTSTYGIHCETKIPLERELTRGKPAAAACDLIVHSNYQLMNQGIFFHVNLVQNARIGLAREKYQVQSCEHL